MQHIIIRFTGKDPTKMELELNPDQLIPYGMASYLEIRYQFQFKEINWVTNFPMMLFIQVWNLIFFLIGIITYGWKCHIWLEESAKSQMVIILSPQNPILLIYFSFSRLSLYCWNTSVCIFICIYTYLYAKYNLINC